MDDISRAKPVVLDASPVIGLSKIGQFDLLQQIFGTVAVTSKVRDEVLRGDGQPGDCELGMAIEGGWVEVVDVETNSDFSKLGAGEAATLAYARKTGGLAVLDDQGGRSHAKAHGLRVMGIVGVLSVAKRRGIVGKIGPLLDELQKHDFFLSDDLVEAALAEAGESQS